MGKIRDFWSGNRTARTRTISRTKYGKSVLFGISAMVTITIIIHNKEISQKLKALVLQWLCILQTKIKQQIDSNMSGDLTCPWGWPWVGGGCTSGHLPSQGSVWPALAPTQPCMHEMQQICCCCCCFISSSLWYQIIGLFHVTYIIIVMKLKNATLIIKLMMRETHGLSTVHLICNIFCKL